MAASYKDVQLQYLLGGTMAVELLLVQDTVSKATLKKAIREMDPEKVKGLEEWYWGRYGSSAGRGRQPPKIGESRTYKAQQLKGQAAPFLRLPLSSLGIAKGEPVRVTFQDGHITVTG